MKTRREFIQGVGGGLTARLVTRALPLAGGALLWPRRVEAMVITLDPTNPANFTKEGTQTFTAGAVLTLTDASVSGFIAFFAPDPDANPGLDIDLVATFQVQTTTPANANAGNRVVINDGQTHAAIATCVEKLDPATGTPIKGIGLLSSGAATDPASYPVFVPVDWQAAPVTIRLRRSANGDAEIVEVNNVAPTPRALLAAASLAGPTRMTSASVEFGAASVEAICTVVYSAFTAQPTVQPVSGGLNFTAFRLNDTDTTDRVRFRADYTLGAGSAGIDPATQPVTLLLSTPTGGQFYPLPDFNPLNGFNVAGTAGKLRWTLNDTERARTGIESLIFDESSATTGSISLRDFNVALPALDFSTVNVEVVIGTVGSSTANRLTGTAKLVQKPAGSGRWQL
jgi:hypothetical protein